jgi:perosamine synthetase
MSTPPSSIPAARYGASAYTQTQGVFPNLYPRVLGPNASKYVQEVIDSGLTANMVRRLEEYIAKAMGVRHCIATPGCTPALHILAASFGLAPGDEVVVSPVTDYGTVMGIVKENLIPVFADAVPGEINLNAETIEPCLTDRTRAILAVHKTGIVCDMDPINELAKRRGLIVYEDCCQAAFSTYKGRIAGTLSRAAGFSFDSEKTIGSDMGGCVITDDDRLAETLRFLGQSRGGVQAPGFGRKHVAAGYAYRMPMCTAAVTLAQMEVAQQNISQRNRVARLIRKSTPAG